MICGTLSRDLCNDVTEQVFAGGTSVGGAATGAILKGDFNRMWQCTIFNTSVHGQVILNVFAVISPTNHLNAHCMH